MPALVVASVAGLATVQDVGRPGRLREGLPVGGALVPELFARACGAVRNGPSCAAIELLGRITLVARGALEVGTDDGAPRRLRDGETWSLSSDRARVAYAAVRGGLDVPVVLGGRGTLLGAGLGGHEGRALRAGDALSIGAAPESPGPLPERPDPSARIALYAGPDVATLPPGTFEALLGATFVVDARSDRTGVRLGGGAGGLAREASDAGLSTPVVRGVVQLPADGNPVILGPDHPTMGGYPVVAVVATPSLGSLFSRLPGSRVAFVALPSRSPAGVTLTP